MNYNSENYTKNFIKNYSNEGNKLQKIVEDLEEI
jgi:hypothetical protein